MTCTSCPPEVIDSAARGVQRVISRVQRIKNLTVEFNDLFIEIVERVEDDLLAWLNLIPIPIPFDPLAMLACPLTPVVLGLSQAQLLTFDYRTLYQSYVSLYSATIAQILQNYANSTAALQSGPIIVLVQKYIREIQNATGDPTTFVIEYATAQALVGYIALTCPELYNNPSYPFGTFTASLTDFSFDGALPSGLSPVVTPVVQRVAEAESRILAWKAILSVPPKV